MNNLISFFLDFFPHTPGGQHWFWFKLTLSKILTTPSTSEAILNKRSYFLLKKMLKVIRNCQSTAKARIDTRDKRKKVPSWFVQRTNIVFQYQLMTFLLPAGCFLRNNSQALLCIGSKILVYYKTTFVYRIRNFGLL